MTSDDVYIPASRMENQGFGADLADVSEWYGEPAIAVGAPGDSTYARYGGAIYVYTMDGIAPELRSGLRGATDESTLGYFSTCDLNSDGLGDILAAAVNEDGTTARLLGFDADSFQGSVSEEDAEFTLRSSGADVQFGIEVQCVPEGLGGSGDAAFAVVGDNGESHLAIYTAPLVGELMASVAADSLWSDHDGNFTPANLVSGDLDGDNLPELLLGDPQFQDGQGGVWVLRGQDLDGYVNESGWATSPLADQVSVELTGNPDRRLFGFSIASGMDFQNDGFDDFAIGGRWTDESTRDEGAVWFFRGSGI